MSAKMDADQMQFETDDPPERVMPKKDTPSPRPWKRGGCSGRMIFDKTGMLVADVDTLTNSELIVTAANSHDELVAAIGNLISGLMMDFPLVAIGMNDWKPIVAARAALAKARAT